MRWYLAAVALVGLSLPARAEVAGTASGMSRDEVLAKLSVSAAQEVREGIAIVAELKAIAGVHGSVGPVRAEFSFINHGLHAIAMSHGRPELDSGSVVVLAALLRDRYGPPGDLQKMASETITRWWTGTTLIKLRVDRPANTPRWRLEVIDRSTAETPLW